MSSKPCTRLICCVDGTYCTPDGPRGKGQGNISNVYRVCASVKVGQCFDPVSQKEVIQEKMYEGGLGSEDNIGRLDKFRAGVWGDGFKDIIRKVYKRCCRLEPTDEVWFYGFSRGAYIVRAVAGLLCNMGALQSADTEDFEAEYASALKGYEEPEKRAVYGPGQFHRFFSFKTRPGPQIRFVGVFDTVKAVSDRNIYDISFNDAIHHFRHALALNEDRSKMEPEYVFPSYGETKTKLSKRSIVQAWFVGAHLDMGGSAENDGLALYPLQWMLIESRSKGLVLGFSQVSNHLAKIDDPLKVVFPQGIDNSHADAFWSCTTKNGVNISMQDLQQIHGSDSFQGGYALQINRRKEFYWRREAREPFDTGGNLRGFCSFAPQGTIIHPSVYQFLDDSLLFASRNDQASCRDLQGREQLEHWRQTMLGEQHSLLNQGFWCCRGATELDNLKSIRILVCGNTGVGKSTLINRVFGIAPTDTELTQTSDRKRGLHDVREPIIHQDRPDLILHDSGGFEAGDESQMQAIRSFIKEKSSQANIEDRLHLIWFCIEMSSVRTQQTATENLFKAVSEFATEVPIIVVATKMDVFRATQRGVAMAKFESEEDDSNMFQKCKEYAEQRIKERTDMIEEEMREIEGSRFEACVDVAQNDSNSIKRLSDTTMQNVKNEKLKLLYVAAQVADVDLKINAAIVETMKVYRRILKSSSLLGSVPTASTSTRATGTLLVCKAVLQCFGLPTLNADTVFQTVKAYVWESFGHGHSVSLLFAEAIASIGAVGTIALGGGPVFLAAAATNIPLVVPATMRLLLMIATDLILILVRAYQETTLTCVGQPLKKDLKRAAEFYKPFSPKVHQEVFTLVPRSNVVKSFKHNDVQMGLEKIVHGYKDVVTKDVVGDVVSTAARPAPSSESGKSSISSESTRTELSKIGDMIKAATAELRRKNSEGKLLTTGVTEAVELSERTRAGSDDSWRGSESTVRSIGSGGR